MKANCVTKGIPKGVPIFYYHIYNNLKNNTSYLTIRKKDIWSYLHHYKVPKEIRYKMINEMIGYGLLIDIKSKKQVRIK